MIRKLLLLYGLLTTIGFSSVAQNQSVVVTVRTAGTAPAAFSVRRANLKFDKDFAYSFTFDDALSDAFTLGYPLFNGGYSKVDGINYPGLYYTDGCGNQVPFRAGIAWNTANKENKDLHFNTPGNISYHEAVELFYSGWDFFNHSFNHQANQPGIDYRWQLKENQDVFKTNAGIEMRYIVPPSGDTCYLSAAFFLGAKACFSSNAQFNGFPSGADVSGPMDFRRPVYWRNLIASDTDPLPSLRQAFDQWVAGTGPGKQRWWNHFTHRVNYERTGASMDFPDFRAYFEYLESAYGSKGRDNGWFANPAEVFEYLVVREKVAITVQASGNEILLRIDYSEVPANQRYYDISLLLDQLPDIQSVNLDRPGKVTWARKGNGHLLNIYLPDSPLAGIGQIGMIPGGNRLSGYPNPARDSYQIELPVATGPVRISLNGVATGAMPVPAHTRHQDRIRLDLSAMNYPAGMYILQVWSDSGLIGFTKLIIE